LSTLRVALDSIAIAEVGTGTCNFFLAVRFAVTSGLFL